MLVDTIVIEIQVEEEIKQLVFTKDKDTWYKYLDKIVIEVVVDEISYGKKIEMKYCDSEYEDYRKIIVGLFEAKYNNQLFEAQGFFESGLEEECIDEDEDIKVPYDPQLITVAPARFSLKEIVGMIDGEEDEEPVLDLAPDFQRDYVWDSFRQSRLIESILLNIPLPVFYFARDNEGKMQVVDGVQRLTTIYNFFKNKFKLTKLEYLVEECNGKYFKKAGREDISLRPKLVRALRQYQIDCNIIEPSTPENVKLDIFKRLNTGGKELNKQEVRHAFMKKDVRDFVKSLVDMDEFKKATNYSINDKRMMAQELIMRYIGFYCLYHNKFMPIEYTTKMDDFIDNVAIELNVCKNIPYEDIKMKFLDSMKKAYIMFEDYAFRKIDKDENGEIMYKKNPINKSLFITFSILLPNYQEEKIINNGCIINKFVDYLYENNEFYSSISHNTNSLIRNTTIKKVEMFLDNLYLE